MYATVSLVDFSFLSGQRFSQVLSPRSNPSPTPYIHHQGRRLLSWQKEGDFVAIKLHSEFVAWDQNGRNSPTHHCTSPWGSSQSDYPAHRCPLFGAWRVPRVFEPQLTVRVFSQTPWVPFLSPPPQSGPSCFQSRALPRDASADGAYWQATLLHPGTRRITSAPSWGRVGGEEWPPSHRANGWSRLGEAAGCWTEVPTFKGMWHDAAQSVLGKSEHSAAC